MLCRHWHNTRQLHGNWEGQAFPEVIKLEHHSIMAEEGGLHYGQLGHFTHISLISEEDVKLSASKKFLASTQDKDRTTLFKW